MSRTGVDTRPTGAWYAPDADRWQMVPDSPFGVSAASTTVWTGSAMVALVIPTGNNPELIAAASYDPVDDLWTELPPVTLPTGHPVLFLQAAAVDDTVFLCSRWQLDDEDISNAGTDSFVLDNGAWRPVTFIGPSGINGSAPISTGTSLVQAAARVWAGVDAGPDPGDIAGRLLDLPDRRVTDIAQGPLDRQAPQSLWAGDALVSVTFQGAAAAWDIGTDTWVQLPQAPVVFDDDPLAVWTGTQLLLWGRTEQPANADSATPGVVAVGLELTA